MVDPVGNEIDFVYNGGGSNNLLSNIVYSTGLKVEYSYNTIKYKSNHLVKNKDMISCVNTFDKTSRVGKSISYENGSDIIVKNYTGFPKYSVDKREDKLMQIADNSLHYIIWVKDELFITLYHYNRLYLEVKRKKCIL